MQNLIVIIAMLILCRSAKDKRLLFLIAGSCAVFELMYYADMDIALYYGVCAMISQLTAVVAISVMKSTPSKVLAIFMTVQAVICLALIPDWSFTTNEWLQFKLNEFNAILVFILIAIGITASDNAIQRKRGNT